MKTAELTGARLDYWVARAEGREQYYPANSTNPEKYNWLKHGDFGSAIEVPKYSTDWAQGGPIIERDQIFLQPPTTVHYNGGPNNGWKRHDYWRATVSARTRTLPPQNETQEALGVRPVGRGEGETPLIAAMRAKVASHYGDEVPSTATEPNKE